MTIDWHSILLGSEEWKFLPEVVLRSIVMFVIILISLRILGKRSVTQLSVFELGVIIGLGSAAGDPMFYKEVGLLPALMVFVVIVALNRFMTLLINKNEKVEKVLEGQPVYLVEDGKLNIKNFKNESIAQEEFFAQLRQHNVSHLGQVQLGIIETNGTISLFYFEDKEVKWGLPVIPHLYEKKVKKLVDRHFHACACCGILTENPNADQCLICGNNEWVLAINTPRIT